MNRQLNGTPCAAARPKTSLAALLQGPLVGPRRPSRSCAVTKSRGMPRGSPRRDAARDRLLPDAVDAADGLAERGEPAGLEEDGPARLC